MAGANSRQHASTLDEPAHGSFDFVWSLCAFEHLGSLEAGLRFVRASLGCVRLAVHATEFNLSSDDATVERGAAGPYRGRDVEALVREPTREGHQVRVDLHSGDGLLERYYDVRRTRATSSSGSRR